MSTDADVIIAGAGPAGSLAAYGLATRGISVLILEKASFPRYKVCGAGLTHKILQEIPFDLSAVIETGIRNIVFSTGFREVFTRSSEKPLMYCTSRGKLDEFLLQKALEKGARVIHGEKVREVRQDADIVTISTPSGAYRSRLLIGADGATSAVARAAGLRENILPGLAWEAEVKADPEMVKAFSETIFLDWGSFPGGYAWVFPKDDHFSIGVGGPATLSKWMIPYYDRLLGYLASGGYDSGIPGTQKSGDRKIEVTGTMSFKSWPIPVRIKKSRFHSGRILVAGDAAGLTDTLTGEGIYYAVRSGILAAKACEEFLKGTATSLKPYSMAVNRELMPELTEANRIMHLFNTVPLTIHRFVGRSDRAWRAFGKILRGERGYSDVRAGFGRWKFLWGGACHIAKRISRFKENRFLKKGFR